MEYHFIKLVRWILIYFVLRILTSTPINDHPTKYLFPPALELGDRRKSWQLLYFY